MPYRHLLSRKMMPRRRPLEAMRLSLPLFGGGSIISCSVYTTSWGMAGICGRQMPQHNINKGPEGATEVAEKHLGSRHSDILTIWETLVQIERQYRC